MKGTYNEGIKENPTTGKMRRRIYLERRLTGVGISEMPEFKTQFQKYQFQRMTTFLGKFSPTLVREFYVDYKG